MFCFFGYIPDEHVKSDVIVKKVERKHIKNLLISRNSSILEIS